MCHFALGSGLQAVSVRRGPMVEQAVQTVPIEKNMQKKSLIGMPQQGRDSGRMQQGSRGPRTQRGTQAGELSLGFIIPIHNLYFISTDGSITNQGVFQGPSQANDENKPPSTRRKPGLKQMSKGKPKALIISVGRKVGH